ncbi:MAG: DUF374 domain-containing protein [Candidatus Margulisiibacteriota bacterium]|nr:DUF374 domain-containing protein [Candidatus Margulisiibacteriota bacterium]
MIKFSINIYVHIAAALLYSSMVIICKTLRVEIEGKKAYDDLKKDNKNVIFATWHQATFVMFHLYRRKDTAILVTSEVRGQILGKAAEWMGYKTLPIHLEKKITMARSTARLLKYIKQGHDAVVAVDGPKGPLHEVKPGIFYLSQNSKAPIIPVGVKAPLKVTLSWRWDKYFIPLPFSKVRLSLGKTIEPGKANRSELKKEIEKLSIKQ